MKPFSFDDLLNFISGNHGLPAKAGRHVKRVDEEEPVQAAGDAAPADAPAQLALNDAGAPGAEPMRLAQADVPAEAGTATGTAAGGGAVEAATGFSPELLGALALGGVAAAAGGGGGSGGGSSSSSSYTSPAGDAVIDLGSYGKLIQGVQVDGNWYYYWDRSGNGTSANTGSLNGGVDYTTHDVLDGLFRYASDFTTLDSDSDTDNTYRYATLNGVRVALPTHGEGSVTTGYRPGTAIDNSPAGETNPTYDDLLAIWDGHNGSDTGTNVNGTPSGWQSYGYLFWSATPSSDGHASVGLGIGYVGGGSDGSLGYVALQVL